MKAGLQAQTDLESRAKHRVSIIDVPVEDGLRQKGCCMGPAAYRTAGLEEMLLETGHRIGSWTVVQHDGPEAATHPNPAIRNLGKVAAWTRAVRKAVYDASRAGNFPVILGGDHSLAMGALSALSQRAKEQDRPLFVLWLDAHPDIHSLDTTTSGNLHGVSLGYLLQGDGFDGALPANPAPIPPDHICMMGIRSVDQTERDRLKELPITVHDMQIIDEHGVVTLLRPFLEDVAAANGLLHVSLDVDFLDPEIAPGVNTTVPGGATFREAHLIMEMVHASGLCASFDMAELNPYLDDRGRTARLMLDLAASLLGRQVLDRPRKTI